jgi:sigma-B regulation protein RsbU (phosphoserine phosphatase)
MTDTPNQAVSLPDNLNKALFFQRLMELLPDHVYFKDREGRFLCINRAQAEFFKLRSPAEAVGKSDRDFFPLEFAKQKDEDEREIVRTGRGFIGKEERSDAADHIRWTLTTKLPLLGNNGEVVGTFGISRDITETKQAREALQEQHRLLKTLIEILPCRIFVKDNEGRLQVTNEAYRRNFGAASNEQVYGRRVEEFVSGPRAEQINADDKAVLEQGLSILNREEYDSYTTIGHNWSLLSKVPLLSSEGRVQGIVGMSADITQQKEAEARALRTQRELEERGRQMESELALAREMQTELMNASVQNVRDAIDMQAVFAPRIVYVYEPCAHLAGDFFQAIPLSPNKFGLLVCDVMGHGVKAALVTTLMRGLLAELTARDVRPSQVLATLNNRLCALLDRPSFPRFVTALYATVDVNTGHLMMANAGHPWPLWMDKDTMAEPISMEESGPALGLIPDAEYDPVERLMPVGTRLLLYTDGLKEEQDGDGDEFGTERLAAAMQASFAETPERSLQHILECVRNFSGNAYSGDDLCAVMTAF